MIVPHKYMNLDLSIINLGGAALQILQEHGCIRYDELLNTMTYSTGDGVKEVFGPMLSFLYLLGKIEYRKDIDTIEYIK